jgi:Tol biopolymer transport system component
MDEAPIGDRRQARSLRSRHPLWVCVGAWLFAVIWIPAGVWAYSFVVDILGIDPSDLPIAANPVVPTLAGLLIGACFVLYTKRALRRRGEETARQWVFPRQTPLRRELLIAGIAVSAGVACALSVRYLEHCCSSVLEGANPLVWVPALLAGWIGLGAAFLPQPLAYPDWLRVYRRAQWLAARAREGSEECAVPPDEKRVLDWPSVAGYLSIAGVLAAAAWLQWGLPRAARAEPPRYTGEATPEGRAIRLTYGVDAIAPAISPDGKLIAYVRDWLPYARLEVMRADGHDKTSVGTDTGASPTSFHPPEWSPDGSKVLLVGVQRQRLSLWSPIPDSSQGQDLWSVDVKSGAAVSLTTSRNVTAGMWLPSVRSVAVAKLGKGKRAHLWLMRESGGPQREVVGLTVSGTPGCMRLWHDGGDLVAVGAGASPGIWSVGLRSGRATRLSNIHARWALPLDEDRLVIGIPGRVERSRPRGTSIAIFSSKTGKVKWLLRDIQGWVGLPSLLPGGKALLSTLYDCTTSARTDLLVVSLQDGKAQKLSGVRPFGRVDVSPDGSFIVYESKEKRTGKSLGRLLGMDIWRFTPARPWSQLLSASFGAVRRP